MHHGDFYRGILYISVGYALHWGLALTGDLDCGDLDCGDLDCGIELLALEMVVVEKKTASQNL